MNQTVIVDGLRTAFGKLGGVISGLSAVELAAPLIKELVERNQLTGSEVDEVIIGQAIGAGCGQIPSRQAAIRAGLPVTCESTTINKVCASGMRAVTIGDLRIACGGADIILAGGMESMSQAPFLLEAASARFGKRMGHARLVDAMLSDGLECPLTSVHMGVYGSRMAEEFNISRQSQDEWAFCSHQLACRAQREGRLAEEILPLNVLQRRGQVKTIDTDEAVRAGITIEALAALKPVFDQKGTITAGNAPGVNDGAAMLLIMSEKKASDLGLKPLARIVTHAAVGQDAPYLATVPALACRKALAQAGLSVSDLGVIEINEAFAAVTLTSMQMLAVSSELVNVNGGAIAIGHPIGASGARILLALSREMKRRSCRFGAAAICSGTAQGDCVILSREGLE